MRLIFTFLLLTCFLSAQAQLLFSTDEVILASGGDYIDYGDVTLTNTGNETIELGITLEKLCLVPGDLTEIQVCLGLVACFLGTQETTTWGEAGDALELIGPGDTFNEVLKFTPTDVNFYESEWNIIVFDRNDPNNSATLHILIEDDNLNECSNTAVSTYDFAYEIGEAFPNPATEMITIPYQVDVEQAQLQIYNSLGVQVESVALDAHDDEVQVNVADYTQGVYFYNITNGKSHSKMLSFVK